MNRLLTHICLFSITITISYAQPLKIVASQTIIADWVNNVGGDQVNVSVLVPADGDVHTFEPSPAQARAISHAQLIFENGLGFEMWMERLYGASDSKAPRIMLGQIAETIELDCPAPCGHHHHVHGKEIDPHVWMDVSNAIKMVNLIKKTLADKDPQNKPLYEKRTQAYIEKLIQLDNYIKEQTQRIPQENRVLITNHESLNYFAKAYGYKTPASLFGSTSTEVGEPSARAYAQLVDLIKKLDVKAVFKENIQSSRLIQELAKEAGLNEPKTLYTGNLSNFSGPADSYIKMMAHNINTIVGALQ